MIEPIEMNVDFSTQDTEMNVEADMNCRVEIPLPIASAITLGGIKVGENLSITEDGTLSADANADDVDQLKNALTSKTEADGAYPDLTAGQVLSKNEASDSVPYNFRAVEQDATLEYTDAIVGGSVVWNQLYIANERTHGSGVVITRGSYGEAIFNGTASSADNTASLTATISVYAGHKYILLGGTSNYPIRENNGRTSPDVFTYSQDSGTAITFPIISGTTYSNFHIYGIFADLTVMFGTAIADYVYTLETATSGSGIAWLKKRFPKMFTYQEYNAGEIVSVQGLSQHVTVGFNQWDEEWEVGGHRSTTGEKVNYTDRICSKNYIPVIGGETYYRKAPDAIANYFYDANKKFISMQNWGNNDAFTTPTNAHYMMIDANPSSGTTYNHDICINLSDPTRNGEYEPYVKHAYPLDDSLTLRGILKLDSNNQLYADGDRYLPDGTVQRRYGLIELGARGWTRTTAYTNPLFYVGIADKLNSSINIVTSIYANGGLITGTSALNNMADKTIGSGDNANMIYVRDDSCSDVNALKSKLNGVYLVYELATPTTEEADSYTVPQIVDPDGTEEYVSTSIVPVWHESRYPLDIAGRLDKILTMPTANGTYTLRATINNGAVTYAWVST